MADPRTEPGFERLNPNDRTYKYDGSIVYDPTLALGSVSVGKVVSIKSNKTVGLSVDGEAIRGKLMKVEKDVCAVQCGGTALCAPGTAAAVTPGKKAVGAALAGAPGYVRESASDTEAAKSTARIEGSLDATNIIIDFG
jgi:hypothetical protein